MIWVVFALLAAILSAFASIIDKKALFKEHAMEFSAVLAIFNFIITLPMLIVADFSEFTSKIWLLLVINSILGGTAFLFYAKGLRHSQISISSSLLNFRPAMVFLLAFIFLKERMSYFQILGMIILLIGAYILEIKNKSHGFFEPLKIMKSSKSIHFIFLAIILYGITSIIDKKILTLINVETYMVTIHFFMALVLIFYLSIFHNGIIGLSHGIKNVWRHIALVAVLTTTYRFLQANAVSLADVSMVSPIKHTSTLFTVIIGGKLFHEENLKQKVLASLIMIIGVTFIILG